MHPCLDCGNPCSFNAKRCRHCSSSNHAKQLNTHWLNIPKLPKEHFLKQARQYEKKYIKTCPTCGSRMDRHSKHCMSCHSKIYRGSKSPSWRGGNLYYTYNGEWRDARKIARKKAKGRCQICGKSEAKNGRRHDTHHITEIRSFLIPEASHYSKNLICVCRKCHSRLHLNL